MNRFISFMVLLVSVGSAYGQVTLSVAPEGKEYSVNEQLIVTFTLRLEGENMIPESRLQLPDFSKFEVVGAATYRDKEVDMQTGNFVNQMIYQCALIPKKSGKLMIGSALVTVNGKRYKTEPFDIYVKDSEKRNTIENSISENVTLNLEVEEKSVYQNQPTLAVLKAYSNNMNSFRKLRNVKMQDNHQVYIKPINTTNSEIEDLPNRTVSQVLGVYLVFPNENGTVELPSATASVGKYHGVKIQSNKIKLNVKKLPENAPKGFHKAVGNFKVELSKISVKELNELDKPFEIQVRMSGEGNLSIENLPKLAKSSEYTFFPPKYDVKTMYDENGIKGYIDALYLVMPKQAGNIKVQTESFAFFNPKTQKYTSLGNENLVLNIHTPEQIANLRTPIEKVNVYTNNILETVNTPILKVEALKVKEKGRLNWNAIVVNTSVVALLFLGVFIYRNVRRRKERNAKLEAEKSKPLGSVSETEHQIREELKADIDDYFSYLKRTAETNDSIGFFKTIDELDDIARQQYFHNSESELLDAITEFKGAETAKNYSELKQQIQMMKYAPVQSKEDLEEILEVVIKTYSEINK